MRSGRTSLRTTELLTELQRDYPVLVDSETGRRVLVDDPVVLGATGIDIGSFVQFAGPAEGSQARFRICPEHAGQIGHDELVSLRYLYFDNGVLLNC